MLGLVLAGRTATARDGRVLLGALALWALVRAAVTLTWRDPAVVWELNAGTLIALGVGLGFGVAFVVLTARRHGGTRDVASEDTLPAWPDPADRPTV